MMNYAAARQLATGGWHYTIRNNNQIWRHRCCEQCDFSVSGHPTKEDAYQCAHDYALKSAAAWEPWSFGGWRDCCVCGYPTKAGAMWDGAVPGWPETRAFCDEHLTDENVLAQVEAPRYLMFS